MGNGPVWQDISNHLRVRGFSESSIVIVRGGHGAGSVADKLASPDAVVKKLQDGRAELEVFRVVDPVESNPVHAVSKEDWDAVHCGRAETKI